MDHTKECYVCKEKKSLDEFYFRSDTKTHENICKKCRHDKAKQNYLSKHTPYQKKTKMCAHCQKEFEYNILVNGKWHSGRSRKFCYVCSPVGTKDCRPPDKRTKDENGNRVCRYCNVWKPLTIEFFFFNKHDKCFLGMCRVCMSERSIIQQKNQKIKCLNYKGNKCQICGYDKCARSLHFHHIDESKKEFTFGKYRKRSWEVTQKELDKCILVCANCHGEIHDKIIKVPDCLISQAKGELVSLS